MERECLNPAGAWDTAGRSYRHVFKIISPNGLIFLAGQAPVDENFKVIGGEDVAKQTRATFAKISRALEAAGASIADIVDMTVHLLDIEDKWVVRQAREEFFPDSRFPVSAMIGVTVFAVEGMRIEIDAIAAV